MSYEDVVTITFEQIAESNEWKDKIREFAKKFRFVGVSIFYEQREIYVGEGENLKWKINHAEEKIRGIVEEHAERTILVSVDPFYFYVEFTEKNFEKAIAIIESAISGKTNGIYFLPNIIKDASFVDLEAVME